MNEQHTTKTLIVEDDGSPMYLDGCQAQYSISDETGRTVAFVKDAEYAHLFVAARDMQEALIYYRDECSGAEPSLSIFHRMLDAAVAKAMGEVK